MKYRLLFLAALLSFTSAAFGQSTAPDRIDDAALLRHVQVLSADSLEGRRTGTEGGAKARRYVVQQFEAVGLSAFDGGFVRPFQFAGRNGGGAIEAANVVGYVTGTAEADSFLVVTAHYDHLGIRDGEIYNGADDNASGVAALIEAARYLAAHPARHSIVVAALDGEEMGLRGARAFLAEPPVPADQMVLDVNLDMLSRNEHSELYVCGTRYDPELRALLAGVTEGTGVKLRFGHDGAKGSDGEDWTFASDHGPFHRAGIPFVYFGVEDHPDYHKPTDEYQRIQPPFFNEVAEVILQSILVLDEKM